ncbi:MAG TPA: hypothetical protein VFC45_13745 [Pseudolabrys sp.]|nr:hypothetical protein [Pseudolabrys sp.]
MAEGGWVVLGAAVGTIGSILTTWLNAWLTKKAPDYFDKKAMDLLTSILKSSSEPWHNIKELANVIGLTPDETKQLLLLIGARVTKAARAHGR